MTPSSDLSRTRILLVKSKSLSPFMVIQWVHLFILCNLMAHFEVTIYYSIVPYSTLLLGGMPNSYNDYNVALCYLMAPSIIVTSGCAKPFGGVL